MRVLSLHLTDFKSYRDTELDLSGISLASVVGANGAGKSSLLEAITFALTGARGLRNLDSFIRQGAEECRVSLTFSMGAERYRITRTRSNRNSGKSTVELARQENGLWVAEGSGAREIDARVQEVLGVDEDILLLTSIVAQGDAGSFFTLRPAQRLEALGAILKLDEKFAPIEKHFKAKAEAAKAEIEDARREITRLESDVAALETREAEFAGARESLKSFKARMVRAEEELEQARERARAAQGGVRDAEEATRRLSELTARRSELNARRTSLAAELDRAKLRIDERPALEAELNTRDGLEQGLAALAEAERADAETRQRRAVLDADLRASKEALRAVSDQGKPKKADLERALAVRASAQDRITDIEDAEVPVCDRCGQSIQDVALGQTLAQLRDEYREADYRSGELQIQVENLREEFNAQAAAVKAKEAEIATLPAFAYDLAEHQHLKQLRERLSGIPAKLAEIAAIEERSRKAVAELHGVSDQLQDPTFAREMEVAERAVAEQAQKTEAARECEQELRAAEGAITIRRRELSEFEKAVARHEEAIAMLGPSRDQLKAAQKEARELEEEQADANLLRKAFSKWGIPALIIGNVLLALEREVNELLALYDGGLAVRFESERETRDGSRDSLEIMVFAGADWRPYETFSGGERYRVASAMRLGLALLLAHRSGARVETLIVDEPEGLDVEGRQHLARILERMSEHFGLVLLLTHYDDLKDAMPSQVVVTRGDDGLSAVEVRP